MADLNFKEIHGSWWGQDYPQTDGKAGVTLTAVSMDKAKPGALIFMTHMAIDYDGAPKAYGKFNLDTLDALNNAGWREGYYGVQHLSPKYKHPGLLLADDKDKNGNYIYADPNGDVPVINQELKGSDGKPAGYFISTTAGKPSGNQYLQSSYIDSSINSYYALGTNCGLLDHGIQPDNFGIVIRPDTGQQARFTFLGGEAGGGKYWKVGECSYKVFLDLGGQPRPKGALYADNNFPTMFVVFPGWTKSQLLSFSLADNAEDFAAFMAFQAQVDGGRNGRGHSGGSGMDAFNRYKKDGRKIKPPMYDTVVRALRAHGYAPTLRASLTQAKKDALDGAAAILNQVLP
ncbi:MAG TPA: hypothetical protein VGL53_17700 [Bryobacteraceae bacterium]|jgi:hypothetical protein